MEIILKVYFRYSKYGVLFLYLIVLSLSPYMYMCVFFGFPFKDQIYFILSKIEKLRERNALNLFFNRENL